MYVGITRARRRLVLSRAWYYRDNIGAEAAVAVLGGGARDRARRDREHRLPAREPVPARRRAAARAGSAASSAPPTDPAVVARLEAELERLREVEAKQPPAPAVARAVDALGHGVPDLRARPGRVLPPLRPARAVAAVPGREAGNRAAPANRAPRAGSRRRRAASPEDVEEPYDLDPGERTRRRRTRVGRADVGELPAKPLRPAEAADGRAAVHALPRPRRERHTAGSTRSTSARTAPGRSSTSRPARATRTPCSSRSTRARSRRSGARGHQQVVPPPRRPRGRRATHRRVGQGHRSSCAANSRRRAECLTE